MTKIKEDDVAGHESEYEDICKDCSNKVALEDISNACCKIYGVTGLLMAGETTEDLVLQHHEAFGVASILNDCASDIQERVDELVKQFSVNHKEGGRQRNEKE